MWNRKQKTKSESVADALREKILSGFFRDGRLPQKAELKQHFSVSQKTIENAIEFLRNEGLVYGVRGSGLFVSNALPEKVDMTHRLVLMLLNLSGNPAVEFFDSLRDNLWRKRYYPIVCDWHYRPLSRLEHLSEINSIANSPIAGVILSGGSYWRNPFLQNHKNLKSIVTDFFDAPGKPPWGAVLTDYIAAGEAIAEKFRRAGCRRFLYINNKYHNDVPVTKDFLENHPAEQTIRGIQKSLQPGETFDIIKFTPDRNSFLRETKEFFQSGKKFDAVICAHDSLALSFGIFAEQAGYKYRKDFQLCGTFNTPLCKYYSSIGPFPSICMNEKLTGEKTVELLEAGCADIIKLPPVIAEFDFRQMEQNFIGIV